MKKIIEKIKIYRELFLDFHCEHEGVFMTFYLILFIGGFIVFAWHFLVFVNYLTNG